MKFISTLILFASVTLGQQVSTSNQRSTSNPAAIASTPGEKLSKMLPRLMSDADVPGISIALIEDGEMSWNGSFGVKNTKTKEPLTDGTIFEAASLTKPVVAYAVMKLVDQGKLDLDKPLSDYLGNNYDVGPDKRLKLITARRVLSHTSGFPNWRRGAKKLPINFTPGEKFSYSGEGFVYLSKVVEKITGEEFGKYIKRSVLLPLGMKESSIDWETKFYKTKVFNHDQFGIPRGQNAERGVNAAASLHTNAIEYAKFVSAILRGRGLSKESHQAMLSTEVVIDPKKAPGLSWGLGWGLQTGVGTKSFWHWGDNGYNKSFVIADKKTKDGVVFFTNSANGLSFAKEILEKTVGGANPAVAWIGYERFDSPARKLAKSIYKHGAAEALKNLDGTKLSERQINRLGYSFMRIDRIDDAILIFEKNTKDHPKSGNVWDSLAEALLKKGNREKAIEYYKKALSLDPDNKNAARLIRELSEKKP